MKNLVLLGILCLVIALPAQSQKRKRSKSKAPVQKIDEKLFKGLKWRNIGPFRGGRSVAVAGVVSDPMTYYMGGTGGGVWKTEDGGILWKNISDGFLKTGTVGAIGISESDPNVIYVGMGEHAVRGVMTSSGDGMYKSTDAGQTWKHIGLTETKHISDVIVHPTNPDVVYVSAQGSLYGPNQERGIYRSTDGGENWKRILFVNENTGASSLSMDMNNPRILYAAMWEYQRYPWTVKSGGPGSGIHKSLDGGETWEELTEGLPEEMGKMGVDVSRANSQVVYAVIEAEGEKGGVYRSSDGGKKWKQTSKDRVTITRSWYYMEIFADPVDENKVYVLNAPMLKSINGGASFQPVAVPHGDNHDLWINPTNNQIMINANDGGANVSFNGAKSWSTQQNQPTSQFYRVITDNQVPYHVYGGQQDNSAIAIASRTNGAGISWKDWYSVAGCESAFLAFDPNNPVTVYGGCYQGIIDRWEKALDESSPIMQYPELALGKTPKDQKHRFNWNAPIIASPHDPNTIYHAGNKLFKTTDGGISWETISEDLTRNDTTKHGPGGYPFTNEAAGGENYNTIAYVVESPKEKGTIWVGTDDGKVQLTRNDGKSWSDVTPSGLPESLVNAIDVSPHDPGTAYIAVTRYKFEDHKPYIYKTSNYGQNWNLITSGIDKNTFVRVVREDRKVKGLLYAGTERGLYISPDDGQNWFPMQLNLPIVAINDLALQDNDLVAATAGRSFWILDDLSAIQQTKGVFGNDSMAIYKPKDTYRLFGGSTPELVPGLGQNPKEGVTIDYYLASKKDTTEVLLKILDGDEVIRTYSNQKDNGFKPWQGGPPPPQVIPSEKGINRFTWDFRVEGSEGVPGVFVFGDSRGHRVAPGEYGIRLVLGEDSVQTSVTILADPRISASSQDFEQQQSVMIQIEETVGSMHDAVNDMRSAKDQISNYEKLLKEMEEAEILLDSGKSIKKKISNWEKRLIQPKQKTFQDVINFQNQLNAELLYLKSLIDQADPRMTRSQKERLNDLVEQWSVFNKERDQIIDEDMKKYNEIYQSLELPAIILKERKDSNISN